MQVPTVTLEDLHAFQAKHFPGARKAAPPATTVNSNAPEAEDDLGYYPDGVKRTLTDEQIRIFRHSEIHALLRAGELKRDEAEYEARMRGGEEGASAVRTDESVREDLGDHEEEDTAVLNAGSSSRRGSQSKQGHRTRRQTQNPSSEALDYDEQQEGSARQARTAAQQYSGRRIVSYAEE